MIDLENYYQLRHSKDPFENYDQIWLIMRFPKEIPTGWKHIPELAPSVELFQWARNAKQNSKWDLNSFRSYYVPTYIRELVASGQALSRFQELLELASAGKRIALVCTCYRECECHRSIPAGIIQGMRPDIEVKCEQDYSEYWHRMRNM